MGRREYDELADAFARLFYYGCKVDSWLMIMIMLPHVVLHWNKTPLWLRIIAPPGSGKTAHINLLRKLATTFMIDDFSAKSIISGFRGQNEDPSQLPQMDGKVVTIADESTIMEQRKEERNLLQSIFRRSYDGTMTKSFGNIKKRVEHRAHYNILIASTPAVDHYYQYNLALGERFLNFRMQLPNLRAMAERAMWNQAHGFKRRHRGLAKIVRRYIHSLEDVKFSGIKMNEERKRKLIKCASFIARVRTHVPRDISGRYITSIPQLEVPTRLVEQLTQVVIGCAAIMGDKRIKNEHLEIATYVGLCSVPSRLVLMMHSFWMALKDDKEWLNTKEVSAISRMSVRNVQPMLEDLVVHNILDARFPRVQGGRLTEYGLSNYAKSSIKSLRLLKHYRRNISLSALGKKRDRRLGAN